MTYGSVRQAIRKRVFKRDYARMMLCPAEVGFIQFPEFRQRKWPFVPDRTQVRGGNWDRVLNRTVNWSSVYEGGSVDQRGFVPLSSYTFFLSLQRRFEEGVSWQETPWHQWLVQQLEAGLPVRRYRTLAEIAERQAILDQMFDDFAHGRYQERGDDLPVINLGRDGRIALEDGRHRLCVAIVAGVNELEAECRMVHPDAMSSLQRRRIS